MPRLSNECKQTRRKITKFFNLVPHRVPGIAIGAEASQLADDIRDHIQDVRRSDQIGCRACYGIQQQTERIHWGDETTGEVLRNREQVAS